MRARLRQVVEGERGGFSGEVKWQGGGGFRFYGGATVFVRERPHQSAVRFHTLAAHFWFAEDGRAVAANQQGRCWARMAKSGLYAVQRHSGRQNGQRRQRAHPSLLRQLPLTRAAGHLRRSVSLERGEPQGVARHLQTHPLRL
jgi:hypothetical protein